MFVVLNWLHMEVPIQVESDLNLLGSRGALALCYSDN